MTIILIMCRLSAFISGYPQSNWMKGLGPKVVGQLTQKLFHGQLWAIPLLLHYQLSR